MKIDVLYGGVSAERDVSLSSGRGIIEALEKNNHEVIAIDFHPDKINDIIALDVDLVFLGLHGKYGEDGRIQGLLDIDRKSTRLNSSHVAISYAVFCLKKKRKRY